MAASARDQTCIAIHGFLGLPSDWQIFVNSRDLPFQKWITPNLWSDLSALPPCSGNAFDAWAEAFVERVRSEVSQPAVLIGYSMGGRLAMHAVLKAPELFSSLVLVSANPGLKSEEEREKRVKHDARWAERFRLEPWSLVIQKWNEQGVLAPPFDRASAYTELHREESRFSRELLARSLEEWSLGRQGDLSDSLRKLKIPVTLISGADDSKFTLLQQELRAVSSIRHEIIESAGHRVPWDNPDRFKEILLGLS